MKQNKPLVGHNCILDLLHMHTHFIGPLPEVRTHQGGAREEPDKVGL